MKRSMWLMPVTLLACVGTVSLTYSAARGDGGGGGQGGGQQEVRLRASLTGVAIKGITPGGRAEFRSRSCRKEFKAEFDKVNLMNGTVLSVNVNGVSVGMITLAGKRGELELKTDDGATIPDMHHGDAVTVTLADGTTVESGTF